MCVFVLCVSQTGDGMRAGGTKGIFIYFYGWLPKVENGGGGEEDEDRSLHEGSVSMVIRRRRRHCHRHQRPVSAPLKAVLRQQMFVSPGALSWGAVGRVGVFLRMEGEQEEGLNRFSG